MKILNGANSEFKIYLRERDLKEKWDGVNDKVTVNESQFSFIRITCMGF